MSKRGLLWVEVTGKYVYLRDGGTMPKPRDAMTWSMFGGNTISRKEFARWSGVTFPGEGIYGLAIDFAVVSRYRKVVEETKVACVERNAKWVKV